MSEHDTKPVARQWCAHDSNGKITAWYPEGYGDEAGWISLSERHPGSVKVEYRDLYPASDIAALQEEVRKQTFRADSNHRIMLNHAEASSAKSVEIQNLKAYIDKMTAEVQDAIGRERKRAEVAEKRALDNEARIKELEVELEDADELIKAQQHDFAANNIRNAEGAARANAAERRLREAVKVLEPFASVIEDYDPWKEGDDTQGTLVIGSVTDYRLTLGHFRAARAFIKEIDQ